MDIDSRYSDYDSFAWFYDRYWSRGIPLQLLGAVERLLLPRLPAAAPILDVCCGTGVVAGALADRGFRLTGIDGSEEMLRHAHRNAPGVEFRAADARTFELPPLFQGAISLFDSLNHIRSAAELRQVFERVHAALANGGWFLFDLNMERSFELHWRGNPFTTVEPDHVSIVRGTYDAANRLARWDLTLFRLLNEQWQRSDLVVEERCHPEPEVLDSLREAGFSEIQCFDADRDLNMAHQVGRRFFLARKVPA